MHERSLVRQLIDQVVREAEQRGLSEVREIKIQIGEFSGVESRLVQFAFEELAPEVWSHQVELNVEVVPLTARCPSCDCQFFVDSFRFVCPECGAVDLEIVAGEEMMLVSLVATKITAEERVVP